MRKEEKNSNKKSLNKNQIVQTALKILKKEGLERLTMRHVAKKLDIKAASLYWHVNNKGDLLQLLVEEICNNVSLPDPELPWQEQIIRLANEYRTTLLSIRDSARILANTTPTTPNRLQLIENFFQILDKAGFNAEEVSGTAHIINNYVISSVIDETRIMNRINQYIKKSEASTSITDIFRKLPADSYPTLVKFADYAANPNQDKQFQFGLKLLLDGLNKN